VHAAAGSIILATVGAGSRRRGGRWCRRATLYPACAKPCCACRSPSRARSCRFRAPAIWAAESSQCGAGACRLGWAGDDHASAFATFYASCRPIVRAIAFRAESANSVAAPNQFRSYPSKGDARNRLGPHPLTGDARKRLGPRQPAGDARKRLAHGQSAGHGRTQLVHPQPMANARPIRAALEEVCARAIKAGLLGSQAARQFFETNFVPVRIRKLGDAAGFVTGYYEPIVDGSRFPTQEFRVPLYRRPRDLVAPGIPNGGPFPDTGRAFRRTAIGELVPYYDRAEIEDGALDGQHLEICWLRTAAEALTIQIEGSARVRLRTAPCSASVMMRIMAIRLCRSVGC
jgi:hypothetical protein